MAVDLPGLIDDLRAESDVVIDLLTPLAAAQWSLPTPADGWTIADQVSHLAYFDETATLAAVDPERFRTDMHALLADGMDFPDRVAAQHRHLMGDELLAWFTRVRAELLAVFSRLASNVRLPWYGPEMGPASSLTARLMETWAHGQDIADALGVERPATDRLRHVAELGVRTIGFAFDLNSRPRPNAPIRVELDGGRWSWGPADAADRVSGSLLDFCLVVTQRRNVRDTGLRVTGPVATEWISIAQTFAGVPGPGRAPAQVTS